MNIPTEIIVLLCFLGMAGIGIATASPTSGRTSSNWLAGAGLLGAIGCVFWLFLHPGGDSFTQFVSSIRDFLRPN